MVSSSHLQSPLGPTTAEDYHTLLESFAGAIWETDPQGKAVTDSPSWRAYTGQSLQQWLSDGPLGAVHPDQQAAARDQWQQALGQRTPFHAQVRLSSPEGDWHWATLRAVPTLHPDGSVKKWLGLTLDSSGSQKEEAAGQQLRQRLEQEVKSQAAQLADNQQLLQATLDSSLDLVQVFKAVRDVSGQITDFVWVLNNQAAQRVYGDVLGESLLTLNPGVVEEGIFDTFRRVVETGLPDQSERHYVHEQFDGWFYQSTVKLNDGVATTTTDITLLKQAEEELRRAKDLVQTVFDVSLNPMAYHKAVRDENGTIVDFEFQLENQQARQYAHPDRRGQKYSEAYPGILDTVVFRMYTDVVETGHPLNTEVKLMLKGTERWFQLMGVKLNDGLVATALDITERKKDEAEILRLKEERLRKATDKYRILFEAIDEGFCVQELLFDGHGEVADLIYREANAAFVRHTGLADCIGKRASEVFPHLEPGWFEALKRVYQTGVPLRTDGFNTDTQRWFTVHYSPVGGEGSPLIAAVFEDITDRKQREQHQTFLLRFSDALRAEADGDAIVNRALQLLTGHLGLDRCYVGVYQLEEDRGLFPYQVGNDQVPPMPPQGVRLSDFPQAMRIAFDQTLVITDFQNTEGLTEVDKRNFAVLGFGALVVATVRKGEKNPHWAINAVSARPRRWTNLEIQLVEEATERTWTAQERVRAEAALRGSQKRFESIANLVPDLLWDSDPDGATHWYNQRWLEYTGQRFEEAIGWAWVDAIYPEDRVATARRYRLAVAEGQPLEQEHRIRRYDGAYRWFVVKAIPVKDERGQVVKMYGAATDIHDRKEAEEALRQSEEKFRTLSNTAPALIWFNDEKGENRFINQHFIDFTGMSAQTIYGLGWHTLVHPDEREAYVADYLTAVAARRSWRAQNRIRRYDGQWRWFDNYAQPLFAEDGAYSGHVGVTIDITDRKGAEEALQESEKRLRLTIEATNLATWDWHLDTDQVYWNEQHFRLFGLEPRPNPLSPDGFIRHVHPQDQARIKGLLEGAIAQRGVYEAEFLAVREDGTQRWMSGYGRITEERDGQALRMSGVMFDVDQRRRAEEALRLADRRKDEFLAMLAHELRNPMATIRNGLQILTLTVPDETTQSAVAMMNRQTDHLVRMLDDLLDVSRISQGKIALHKERVNLVELVQQAANNLQPQFEQQGKTLGVELSTTPLYLEGDVTRLTQVVTNLLTNGLRYTGDGGTVWLTVTRQRLAQKGSQAVIEVRDNGIGLPPDQLTAIFELFVQVDNSTARSKGGLGLGLTLVKRLVELHGGEVEAHSEGLGKGSTFMVSLPTLPVVNAEEAKPATEPTDEARAMRLLVIDDNLDVAMTLGMLLKLKGYEVHTRHSGQAGLEAAEDLHPAAVLLDIGMPEMDGYETCRILRQQPWGQDLVVIALTGYGGEEDLQRTREAGFDGHLVKPVYLKDLMNLLADLSG